ncbi:MAG TPA: SDR family NAD(P)-dependent oxidoreductase [Magnetospirillaceae bacterium]|nr:SDR family NAD(P)-dependent oxidoreductase [Magnetospirillaceae bacterium]
MEFKGKVVAVTGAARGIGYGIATAFAEAGAFVALVDLCGGEAAAESLRAMGHSASAFSLDITDPAAVSDAASAIEARMGAVDVLVNNAGIIARESILEITYETWRRVLDVNLNGTFNWCKAVVPSMVERRQGRIVNITSVAGKTGDITASPVYGTSKGAVNTLTKSLARQLAEYGITVNGVAPHAIETDMSAEWSPEKRRAILEAIPLRRMGTPREVADAVLYLASDGAGFVTGQILNVNGGFLME